MSDAVVCSNCGRTDLVENFREGIVSCSHCGAVAEVGIVDERSEYRTFSNGDVQQHDPTRAGIAVNPLLKGGFATTIEGGRTPMATWQNKGTVSADDRITMRAIKTVSATVAAFSLPTKFVQRAVILFKDAGERMPIRKKRTIHAMAAACLAMTLREENEPLPLKDIAQVARVDKKDLGRCVRAIKKLLQSEGKAGGRAVNTTDFVERFCNRLELSQAVRVAAEEVAKKATDFNVTKGKAPVSVAAAAIFLITQLVPDQTRSVKEISDAAGCAEGTLRNAFRDLFPQRANLVPQQYHRNFPRLETVHGDTS